MKKYSYERTTLTDFARIIVAELRREWHDRHYRPRVDTLFVNGCFDVARGAAEQRVVYNFRLCVGNKGTLDENLVLAEWQDIVSLDYRDEFDFRGGLFRRLGAVKDLLGESVGKGESGYIAEYGDGKDNAKIILDSPYQGPNLPVISDSRPARNEKPLSQGEAKSMFAKMREAISVR
ncbi:MAG: hypothetical protein AABW80_05250 [Nanoarchaeota archaeon]